MPPASIRDTLYLSTKICLRFAMSKHGRPFSLAQGGVQVRPQGMCTKDRMHENKQTRRMEGFILLTSKKL